VVAMSADGATQTVTWKSYDGTNYRVQVATSTNSGATWSTPATMSAAGQSAHDPVVAMSADGATQTVTWRRSDSSHYRAQVATSNNSGATWSAVADLSAAGQDAHDPVVAMAADGATQTVTWRRSDGTNNRVQVASLTNSTVATAPTGLSTVGGDGSVLVSWTAPVDDGGAAITGYTVSTTPGTATCSSIAPSTSCSVTGLTNGVGYTFTAVAANTNGDSVASVGVSATPSTGSTVATAPRSVSGSPSSRSATVSWTAPWLSGGNSDYTYRATASPGSQSCTTSERTCTITGLNPVTTYSVTVTATNSAGTSPPGTAGFTTTDSIVRPVSEIGVDCNQSQQHPFADIPLGHYSYVPAGCIYQLGVTTGTSATTYAPGNVVTRAQMAAFLARFYTIVTGIECVGNTPFVDVPAGAYYSEAVGCIYDLGITTGTSSTTYAPDQIVTRAQMAAFLARLYSTLTETTCTGTHPFQDVSLTAYYSGPAGCIYNLGITTGTSPTTYAPNNIVTRDQMAAFLARSFVSLTSD
jgi:hypothetical protein